MDNETLRNSRFWFHPDPAMDFLCEVMEIQAEYNDFVRLEVKDCSAISIFSERVYKALEFKAGGVPSCVTAKHNLRVIRAALDTMAMEAAPPVLKIPEHAVEGLKEAINKLPPQMAMIEEGDPAPKSMADILKNRGVVTVGVDLAAPGSDITAETRWVSIEFHRDRERELLEANTRAVERYRAAEEKLREIEKVTSSVAPALLKLIDQQITRRLQAAFVQKR